MMRSFVCSIYPLSGIPRSYCLQTHHSIITMDSSFSDQTPTFRLLIASFSGNLSLLKRLVAEFGYGGTEGAKSLVHVKDPEGHTLLHYAVRKGQTHVYKYLIQDLNLDVNPKDNLGNTPLHYAIMLEHNLTFAYLLDHGAEPNIANDKGLTPLHYAAQKGQQDQLQLLISKGAEVDAQSIKGTPLQFAVGAGMKNAVKILLDNHANPNSVSQQVFTPLVLASIVNSTACARLLLKGGADPNLCSYGMSPLIIAVREGQTEMIKCLLKGGADPNVTNFYDFTPIEIAAMRGSRVDVMALFQATTASPRIPVWSVNGILQYVHSAEAETQRESKVEEKFHEAKAKGAEAVARNAYLEAIYFYTEATIAKPNDATLYSNLSLCRARMNDGQSALTAALACINYRPDWPKAYYRAGIAWKILEEYKKAVEAFELGLKLDPGNKELQDAKREAEAAHIGSMMRFLGILG